MKTLAFVVAMTLLMVSATTGAYARVIAGDLDNSVAIYYFTSLTDSGNVRDYSGNGLHGDLYNGAQLNRVSGRNCLTLGSNAAWFWAWYGNTALSVSKEFSIVAWVKIPRQPNDFLIEVRAYNLVDTTSIIQGIVDLSVMSYGDLRGGYAYNDDPNWDDPNWDPWGELEWVEIETTDRRVNDNTWHHIGFVINRTRMRLYLNGTRIASRPVSGHQSFNEDETWIAVDFSEQARGSIDNVGFFKNDLSDAQVRLIYNQGLAPLINIASVDPGGKVATTWGALKKR